MQNKNLILYIPSVFVFIVASSLAWTNKNGWGYFLFVTVLFLPSLTAFKEGCKKSIKEAKNYGRSDD